MSTVSDSHLTHRDGTGQAGRRLAALDPNYVSVDERTTRDLLAFAKQYAKELSYFNEQNERQGDWSAFLNGDEDEMVAYLQDPEKFQHDPDKLNRYSRPHFALFLTFLELLKHAQTQLNELTRRHLEFYYREALRLTSRDGVADSVHVLVELVGGQSQFRLPAGTLLSAGQDSRGDDLFYKTDNEIVANRAQVTSLKSLFVQKQVVGIREVHQDPGCLLKLTSGKDRTWANEPSQADKAFLAMMDMALGEPQLGDPLPLYPVTRHPGGTVPVATSDRPAGKHLFEALDELVEFIQSQLYLSLPVFRNLMQRKRGLDDADAQWDTKVNDILQTAGRKKKNDKTFVLDRDLPQKRYFERNLTAALGPLDYGGLPEVNDIYSLYFQYLRYRDSVEDVPERRDLEAFIKGEDKEAAGLHMSLADFETMMGFIDETYLEWRNIYDMLRAAGKRKANALRKHKLTPMPTAELRADNDTKFQTITDRTLGKITYPRISGMTLSSFDDCYNELLILEAYFFMAAEDFAYMREIQAKTKEGLARSWEWEQVYELLETAYGNKVLAGQRKALKDKRKAAGLEATIKFALGDPEPGDVLPDSKQFMMLDPINDAAYIQENLFLDGNNVQFIQQAETAASEADWNRVYAILEQAQRRKRGWQVPPTQIEKWENIYIAPDATSVLAQSGLEEDQDSPRWRTFGEGYNPDAKTRTTPATIGLALTSPLLALAEGTRTITLTLGFSKDGFDAAAIDTVLKTIPFRFFLSTEKEMVEIAEDADAEAPPIKTTHIAVLAEAAGDYAHALQVTITLDAQAPPIAPLPAEAGFRSPWPVLQMLLKDIEAEDEQKGVTKPYLPFQKLMLEHVHLKVKVDGLTALTLQSDDGVLKANKPFEPFGLSPVVGSSFYFAHPELCAQRLDSLELVIDWLGAPDDLNQHYLGYSISGDGELVSPVTNNASFQAALKLYDNRSFFKIADVPLFHAEKRPLTGAAKTHTIPITLQQITSSYSKYQQGLDPVTGEEVLAWSRYWQLELAQFDFQHGVYPQAAGKAASRMDKTGPSPVPAPVTLNPPYTPKIKRLTAKYGASLELDLKKADPRVTARLYHVEPFGYRPIPKLPGDGEEGVRYPFLPQYEKQGELYIGVEALVPPQNLSLLFQMAAGSADPDLPRQTVHWEYLSGDAWHSLEEGNLLSDTTNGLLSTGIITFSLESAEPSTLLPPPWYWIRATIAQHSRSVCDTVAIHAQAVRATFADRGNAPDHLKQPLPPKSISGLAESQPEVKAIHQPYSSFGGKGPEQAVHFYTRVSERLRHKNRALTCWDYERLILDALPDVYMAQCLPVDAFEDPRLAASIQITVIPDIRGQLPSDPFEPKVPAETLVEIERYLLARSPPLARFTVKNPRFLQLKARFAVRFREGCNAGYYLPLLDVELQRFLSPWAYDESAEIAFGGKINANLIVNFAEERDYVDYLAGVKLFTSADGGKNFVEVPQNASVHELADGGPDVILVSARQHEIAEITEEVYVAESFIGINFMKIELDFKVAQ